MPNYSQTVRQMTERERADAIARVASWTPGGPSPSTPSWNREDVIIATAQARLARLGVIPRSAVDHPLADGLLASDSELTDVHAIAFAADKLGFDLAAQKATDQNGIAKLAVRASSQLSELFSTSATIALQRQPNPLRAKVERLTFPIACRDFKNIEVVDVAIPSLGLPTPGSGWDPYLSADLRGTAVQLRIGAIDVYLRASIQSVVNGTAIDLMRRGAAAFRYQAYSNELRALANGLDNGVTLSDGDPWFNSSNLVDTGSGAAPSAATLNAVSALLRSQSTAAGVLDLDVATLLVPSSLEATTRTVVHEAGWDITIIASAHLSGDFWYAFSDPAVSPVVARLTFEGTGGESVSFGPEQTSEDGSCLQISASHKVALAPLSRVGLVKYATA